MPVGPGPAVAVWQSRGTEAGSSGSLSMIIMRHPSPHFRSTSLSPLRVRVRTTRSLVDTVTHWQLRCY